MNHFSLLGRLLLVLFITTVLSCTDHRDVPALRFRVKTIQYNNPANPSSLPIILLYSENNLLMAYATYMGSPVDFNNNRVARQLSYTNDGVRQLNTFYSQIFSYQVNYNYDSMKRVTNISTYGYIHNVYTAFLTEDFTYDGTSTLPSSRQAAYYGDGSNGDGGSVAVAKKTERYTFSGGNATSIDGNSYTYDTSPNPYKGLFGFTSFERSSPDAFTYRDNSGNFTGYGINRPFSISEEFSDSSVKVFNQNNRTTDAQLTYNSDGLVTKIVYKDGTSEAFTYEKY